MTLRTMDMVSEVSFYSYAKDRVAELSKSSNASFKDSMQVRDFVLKFEEYMKKELDATIWHMLAQEAEFELYDLEADDETADEVDEELIEYASKQIGKYRTKSERATIEAEAFYEDLDDLFKKLPRGL